MINEENQGKNDGPRLSKKKDSRRMGSSMRGTDLNSRINRKNLLPIINADKKNNFLFGEIDEDDDNF